MDNNRLIGELSDNDIDKLMKYSMPFSEENDENIKEKFLQKAQKRQRRFSAKGLILIAAVVSTLVFSALVYAGVIDFGKIYKIVFGEKSEYVEQYITPYDGEPKAKPITPESAESNNASPPILETAVPDAIDVFVYEYDGIAVKLISAINDENFLRIFVTMTDTTGDRLSKSMIFDSWGLSQGHGGGSEVVDYDPQTKTATVLFTSMGGDHSGRAVLGIDRFSISNGITEGAPENKINFYDTLKAHTPGTMSQEEVFVNGGASQSDDRKALAEKSQLLKFDEVDIKFENLSFSSISNIGFVDGLLHIQTKKLSNNNESELLSINFTDADNEVVHDGNLVLYYVDISHRRAPVDGEPPYYQYKEMLYKGITDAEQLKDLSVTIDYLETGGTTEGRWELSFEVPEKVTTEFDIDHEIIINGEKMKVDKLSFSPLGVTLSLPENIAREYQHTDRAYVEYDDGEVVELPQSRIDGYESESTLSFGGEIIEIERVRKIVVNDEEVNIDR